jgi:HEAT repeat protein
MVLYALELVKKNKIKELLPVITDKLKTLEQKDEDLKSSAISTLGAIGDNNTVTILKEFLKESNLRIKLNALQSICDINSEESQKIVLENLNSETLELSLLSAGFLAQQGNEKALSLLKKGMESPIILTRQKTLIALTNTTNPAILPILTMALKTDDEALKSYTLNILTAINTQESARLIEPTINDPDLMPRALIALSKNSSDEAIKIFESCLSSNDENKKYFTMAVLSKINNESIIPLLKISLLDKNENIQVISAKLLHDLGDDSGISVLTTLADSQNNDISLISSLILGTYGKKSVISILESALNRSNIPSWRKLDILIILENLGEKSVYNKLEETLNQQRPPSLPKDISPTNDTLEKLLKNKSNWIKLNTAVFMTNNNCTECLSAIEELSKDSDLQIRTYSAILAGKLGSQKALGFLEKNLKDESVRVRVNAAKSIIDILSRENSENK